MSITFYTMKCRKCGSKFTLTSDIACKQCKYLGIQCRHKELCLRCFKDNIQSSIFFGGAITIVLIALQGIGGRIL